MSLDAFMNAIGTIESGNNYNAVGVDTGKMGRALGRYQIMSANWGAWSREAGLGSHADWRDPKNQDAVARYMMGKYHQRYGNWDLVATAWFGGPGAANKAEKAGVGQLGNTKDALGTSVPEYVKRYRSVWNPDNPNTTANNQARNDQQPKGPPRARQKPMSRLADSSVAARDWTTPGGRQSTIAPIEAAPGTVLSPGQEATRDAQINQDSLGGILDTISQAAKGESGRMLDLKGFLGMPEIEQPIVGGIPAPEPTAPLTPEPDAAMPAGQGDLPMAAPPKHDGFEPLKDYAKKGAQQLMAQFPGLTFTSGFRDPARNKAAGGSKTSKHMTGDATDFDGDEAEMERAAAWAKANGAKVAYVHQDGDGEGRHLHIEWA